MMSRTVRRVLAILLLIVSVSVWGGPMAGVALPAKVTVLLLVLISAIAAGFVIDEFRSGGTAPT